MPVKPGSFSEGTGDAVGLDAGIDALEQAVAATPPGYPDLRTYLSNLGSSMVTRFQREGNTADLDIAVSPSCRSHPLRPDEMYWVQLVSSEGGAQALSVYWPCVVPG